jgi:hypothetical protein
VIVATYAAALVLPTGSDPDVRHNSGAWVLIDCLRESKCPPLGWLAASPNLALILGLFSLRQRSWLAAGLCGAYGLAGGLLVVVFVKANHPGAPLDLASGYYAWVASMVLLVIGGVFRLR